MGSGPAACDGEPAGSGALFVMGDASASGPPGTAMDAGEAAAVWDAGSTAPGSVAAPVGNGAGSGTGPASERAVASAGASPFCVCGMAAGSREKGSMRAAARGAGVVACSAPGSRFGAAGVRACFAVREARGLVKVPGLERTAASTPVKAPFVGLAGLAAAAAGDRGAPAGVGTPGGGSKTLAGRLEADATVTPPAVQVRDRPAGPPHSTG
jgi:hypothetical protein